jgi:hypothetical protein
MRIILAVGTFASAAALVTLAACGRNPAPNANAESAWDAGRASVRTEWDAGYHAKAGYSTHAAMDGSFSDPGRIAQTDYDAGAVKR